MLPRPPASGAAARIQGATACASHAACPPSEKPVSPMRSAFTPSTAASARAACSASRTRSPTAVLPNGSIALDSRSRSTGLGWRAVVPLRVTASTAKPRRASSRAQPCSGPRWRSGRCSRSPLICSALPLVPGMQTIPAGSPPAPASRIRMHGTTSSSSLRNRSGVTLTPSGPVSLSPTSTGTDPGPGTSRRPSSSQNLACTSSSATDTGCTAVMRR